MRKLESTWDLANEESKEIDDEETDNNQSCKVDILGCVAFVYIQYQ